MPRKLKSKPEKKAIVDESGSVKSPIKSDANQNIFIEIYAKPSSKQNAITGITYEGVNIQINAPPVEGSANTELVKYMASFLGLKSSSVSLERGHKSKNKVLKISGDITRSEVLEKINAELPLPARLPKDS